MLSDFFGRLLRSQAVLRTACFLLLAAGFASGAADDRMRTFEFTGMHEGDPPHWLRSTITGGGPRGEWKVIAAELPLVLAPFSPKAPVDNKRLVIAQVSTDRTETRAPMLVLDTDVFSDFTLTTRIRIVSGDAEQMAGVAFRLQNEKNYYYVRLNAKDHNVAFLRYVGGELIGPISAPADIRKGEWTTLAVECRGAKLRARVNDREVIPWTEPNYVPMPDGTSKGVFAAGKVGLWTKADTVAQFADTKLVYAPLEKFAESLLRDTMKQNPRLLGLKIFAIPEGANAPKIIASDLQKEIGEPGDQVESNCMKHGGMYCGKGKEVAIVTAPLRDRNGEIVGAVRVVMTTFFGQTEKNMLARALPIIQSMEERVSSAKELLE